MLKGDSDSSQGPKEKRTCWLRAGPMPKQPVESRLASLGAHGRPWRGAVGLSSAAAPGPGFIKCASVPLWAAPSPRVAGSSLYLCVWFCLALCQQRTSYWSEVSKKRGSVTAESLLVQPGSGTGCTGLSVSKPGGDGAIPSGSEAWVFWLYTKDSLAFVWPVPATENSGLSMWSESCALGTHFWPNRVVFHSGFFHIYKACPHDCQGLVL